MSLWHRSAHTSKLHQVLAEKPKKKKKSDEFFNLQFEWSMYCFPRVLLYTECLIGVENIVRDQRIAAWLSDGPQQWLQLVPLQLKNISNHHHCKKTLALSQPQKNALIKYVYYIVLLCFQGHTKLLHCVCPTGSTFFCSWCPNLLLEIKTPELTKTVGHFCWWKTKWQLRKYVS